MTGSLDGVKIVDLSSIVAGPMATQILADQGADVIKIEPPGLGDLCRYLGPQRGGMGAMFLSVNRNKRSLCLNLKSAEGRQLLTELIATADIFVENMRPAAIERLGLTYEHLIRAKPDLIYVSMSGFGDHGPYKDRRVYDPVIQAVSGICDVQRDASTGEPRLIQSIVCDKVTALTAAQAMTAALFAKAKGNGGQLLTLNMLDSTIAFMWPDAFYTRTFVGDGATASVDFSRIYMVRPTQDGHLTTIVISDEEFLGLMRALELMPFANDPRFATMAGRIANADALRELISPVLASLTSREASARLLAQDVPHAIVNSRDDVLSDPQILANQILQECENDSAGHYRQPRPPASFQNTPSKIRSSAPKLGEQSASILSELGRTPVQIDALRQQGVVFG